MNSSAWFMLDFHSPSTIAGRVKHVVSGFLQVQLYIDLSTFDLPRKFKVYQPIDLGEPFDSDSLTPKFSRISYIIRKAPFEKNLPISKDNHHYFIFFRLHAKAVL